jgi:propanediol dehydratase small subunit
MLIPYVRVTTSAEFLDPKPMQLQSALANDAGRERLAT